MKSLNELGISKAPWKTYKDDPRRIYDAKDREVAAILYRGTPRSSGLAEEQANTNLVTAAPHLYHALYETYKYLGLDNGSFHGALGDVIKQALAKASGEDLE